MKKLITGAAALVLAVAGITFAQTAAQAHTGDLKVTAVCNVQTGNYDLTATLKTADTTLAGSTMWRIGTSKFDGTPKNVNGMDRGPLTTKGSQTVTLGTFTLPGTTTGFGPWVYAFTSWSDRYTQGSDGQLTTALKGDCERPIPPEPAVQQGTETRTGDPVCVIPADGTATVVKEAREWSIPNVWDAAAWEWKAGEKTYTDWAVTATNTVPVEACAPEVPPVVTPPTETPVDLPDDPTPPTKIETAAAGYNPALTFAITSGLVTLAGIAFGVRAGATRNK